MPGRQAECRNQLLILHTPAGEERGDRCDGTAPGIIDGSELSAGVENYLRPFAIIDQADEPAGEIGRPFGKVLPGFRAFNGRPIRQDTFGPEHPAKHRASDAAILPPQFMKREVWPPPDPPVPACSPGPAFGERVLLPGDQEVLP